MSWTDLGTISPVIVAVLAAAAILLVDLAWPNRRSPAVFTALAGLGCVAVAILIQAGHTGSAFGGSYSLDNLTVFLDMLFVVIGALTILFAVDYLEPRGLPIAEFAAILVFAVTGAMLVAGSTDLLVLFVALELMVLPGYMLAGFARRDPYSTEGAIKYFLLGSFSSAILLFGLAYVWGMTGTTRVDGVSAALATAIAHGSLQPGLAMGLAFMTAGVAFKMAAVPFHYWTPDAYQGSPTPVTAYLSVGPKVGAFAIALRLFVGALGPLKADWLPVVIVLAAVTMTLGNLVAITQDNVKRMLAYSSIAHTGYILVGLAAYAGGQQTGLSAILFYGAAYTFMNMGAFAVVTALQRRPG
ncbi:MAG: NADH-quinone oxidoreductase subunit N, partial [Candidatus Limnocylindrales bacterium]